jgi:hypothetical protein
MSTPFGGRLGTCPYQALAATIGIPTKVLTADHGRNRTLLCTFLRSFRVPLHRSEPLWGWKENVEKL